MSKKFSVSIIGSGFSGLSAACFLAKAGVDVTVFEKLDGPGGRARKFESEGFTFDMGPSWYWMPDVFERFFACFGKKVNEYYELIRLDPSYKIVRKNGTLSIPANYDELKRLFESVEHGSGIKLDKFMARAKYKYDAGMKRMVFNPGRKISELLDREMISGMFRLEVFTSMRSHVNRYFKDERLREVMEFPVLFLGAMAADIPALYSLMNYADIKLGTWYPKGGMYKIVDAMYNLATELGVNFQFNSEITGFEIENGEIDAIRMENQKIDSDVVLATGDYWYIESQLMPPEYRSYSSKYWDKRKMAPSALIYYLGLNERIKNLEHHNLFFDGSFDQHARDIYKDPKWPEDPLFYVCCTSKSDDTVAPPGCENVFILIPVAAGLEGDDEELREKYLHQVLDRIRKQSGGSPAKHIMYKRSYAISDFKKDYHAYKGNAYGLANTLLQTANLKPSIKSKRLKNLYFAGQLTVPGPGVPPSIISGEVAANEILKDAAKLR